MPQAAEPPSTRHGAPTRRRRRTLRRRGVRRNPAEHLGGGRAAIRRAPAHFGRSLIPPTAAVPSAPSPSASDWPARSPLPVPTTSWRTPTQRSIPPKRTAAVAPRLTLDRRKPWSRATTAPDCSRHRSRYVDLKRHDTSLCAYPASFTNAVPTSSCLARHHCRRTTRKSHVRRRAYARVLVEEARERSAAPSRAAPRTRNGRPAPRVPRSAPPTLPTSSAASPWQGRTPRSRL